MARFQNQTNRWQHVAHPVAGWGIVAGLAIQPLPFPVGREFLRGP